ncbi:hypothetical protein C8J56DRAFT_891443 [Mycena floridula]|nr:hypothetical protein C8J56DRAFT_891443 [Mycena floridula]
MSDSEYSIHFQHSPAIASYLKTATPSSLPPWHLRRPSRPSPGWEGDGGGYGREVMRADGLTSIGLARLVFYMSDERSEHGKEGQGGVGGGGVLWAWGELRRDSTSHHRFTLKKIDLTIAMSLMSLETDKVVQSGIIAD